jgi:hypothetical protein
MRHKRVFWIAFALITAIWLAAQLPRTSRFVALDGEATTSYTVGRPLLVSKWTVWDKTGEKFNSDFVPGNILINVSLWLLLVVVVWFLTRPRGQRNRPESPTNTGTNSVLDREIRGRPGPQGERKIAKDAKIATHPPGDLVTNRGDLLTELGNLRGRSGAARLAFPGGTWERVIPPLTETLARSCTWA